MELDADINEAPIEQMHPALDFVNGVVYVAARVQHKGSTLDVVITSEKQLYSPAEWTGEAGKRNLDPYTQRVSLSGCGPRWSMGSIRKFLDGKLIPPTWGEAYDKIYKALDERLVVTDQRYITIFALEVMMSYFHQLFDFLPILHLRGPMGSGKTRDTTGIAKVAFNGKVDGTITGAAFTRRAHEGRYTQAITEMDNLAYVDSQDKLAQYLQVGCDKGEAQVEMTEPGGNGRERVPVMYRIYSPRIICSIARIKSQPLRSRTIQLNIVKKTLTDVQKKKLSLSIGDEAVWRPLRDDMYSLLMLKWKEVAQKRDKLKVEWGVLEGRELDKWLPLATIAALVSKEVLGVVQQVAFEGMESLNQEAENGFDAMLMKFAAFMVKNGSGEFSRSVLYNTYLPKGLEEGHLPVWVKDTDAQVEPGQLKTWIHNERKLIDELKRLMLIPSTSRHTNTGDVYSINQEAVMSIVGARMGNGFLKGEVEGEAIGEEDPMYL